MFEQDVKFGEIGEMWTFWILSNSERVKNIIKATKDTKSQLDDIDFIVEKNNGKIERIEVKIDRQAHKTGNLVYETKSNSNEGCLARSKADLIAYVLVETEVIYWVNVERLRNYIQQNNQREITMGDNAKGLLIPIVELERNGIAKGDERIKWLKKGCSQEQ